MIPDWKIELVANILDHGKTIVPDRFPQPSPQVAEKWAGALGATLDNFPVDIWPEAVNVWSVELVTDRMISPGDLLRAARIVRDRWEVDPAMSELLRVARERARDERDRQLEEGTFGAMRGYRARAVEAPREVPEFVSRLVEARRVG